MSWSFNKSGKPAKIVAEMQAAHSRLAGQSQEEFGNAMKAAEILLGMNTCSEEGSFVRVHGNGSGAYQYGLGDGTAPRKTYESATLHVETISIDHP